MNRNTVGWSSPARYIQGFDIIKGLYKFCSQYGSKAFVLITHSCMNLKSQIADSFILNNMDCEIEECKCEGLKSEIDYYSELCTGDFIIGIGGGKIIGLTKAVAHCVDIPCIIIPSTLSTDAPVTSRSVIYKTDGSSYALKYNKSPDMVIVDTSLIMKSPIRFFVAGIGDAITTKFEAEANQRHGRKNLIKDGFISTYAGVGISNLCYEMLLKEGENAVDDIRHNRFSDAIDRVVEAVILMSGLGSENCGCGIAHSIGEGISLVPVYNKSLHGEQVAFGLICQFYAENRTIEEIDGLIRFYLSVGLPVSLCDLDIHLDMESFQLIAKTAIGRACWQEALDIPIIEIERVIDIIKMADETGNMIKDVIYT